MTVVINDQTDRRTDEGDEGGEGDRGDGTEGGEEGKGGGGKRGEEGGEGKLLRDGRKSKALHEVLAKKLQILGML